jgi:hypothetical protein
MRDSFAFLPMGVCNVPDNLPRVFIGRSWLDESSLLSYKPKKEHEEYSCSCEVELDKRYALNKNQERYYLELYANS